MLGDYEYDVALSFAGEDRAYAHQLATLLKERSIRVFYDKDLQYDLWGKDLYEFLFDVYKRKAMFCVMFVSAAYAKKHWTRHERRAAQERAFSEIREYILPVMLDETEVPGLSSTTGHVSISEGIPEIADLLESKLESHGLSKNSREHRSNNKKNTHAPSQRRPQSDEPVLTSILEWERFFDLDEWEHWVSGLCSGRPRLADRHWEGMYAFTRWLPRKIWLEKHRPIALAFQNLKAVVDDLLSVMQPYFFHNDDVWVVDPFYRHYEKDPELRQEALKQYNAYEHTIAEMAEHLTASGNLVMERIRDEIDEMYRFSEGLLVMQLSSGQLEPIQYAPSDKRRLEPYPGLDEVLRETRWKRDPSKWNRRKRRK